jgi:hypothetical protein
MKNEEKKDEKGMGEMNKRRETMPDGRRYIIYYTFGSEAKNEANEKAEKNENSEVKGNV